MNGYAGRVAVVTGAGSGIGRAVARELALGGARVAAIDRDRGALDRLVRDVPGAAGAVLPTVCDVADWDGVQEAVGRIAAQEGRIDFAVNSAGVVRFARFEDHTASDWSDQFAANVLGVAAVCRAVLAPMRRHGFGRIVNVASWFGKVGKPNYAAYCASKFAVIGLTQSLAHEAAAHGITVNAVCPGTITDTAMRAYSDAHARAVGLPTAEERLQTIPLARLGTPQDVWHSVRFLLSAEADYLTGQSINVTGGLWMG